MKFLSVRAKEKEFLKLFLRIAVNNLRAAETLRQLFQNLPDVPEEVEEINRLEKENDRLFQQSIELGEKIFISRIDLGLIDKLAGELDDVTDWIKATAIRVGSFGILQARPETKEFAEIILKMTELTQQLIAEIEKLDQKQINRLIREIKQQEERADQLLRQGLAKLFEEIKTAILAIKAGDKNKDALFNALSRIQELKWKDIFEALEEVTDHIDHVAEIIRTISRKIGRF